MEEKRKEMVYVITEKYGMKNSEILSVMLQIPRHKFVDRKCQSTAYSDGPVPLGYGQTMSQPYTVAFMTNLVVSSELYVAGGGRKRVLEIGTGSGYQAAILSEFFDDVYTMEIVPELAEKASETFRILGIKNVYVKKGSGQWGWVEKAPFDAVIITAGVAEKVPEEIIGQLKVGGVIVAPIGPRALQTMTRFTKQKNGSLAKEEFEKYVFVPFVEEKN